MNSTRRRLIGPGIGVAAFATDRRRLPRLCAAAARRRTSPGQALVSTAAVKAMTTNHLTPHQRQGGAAILGKSAGWGYGMSVSVDAAPGQPKPGSDRWPGGFGTSWRSDPARDLTAILLTQRAFESPTPAPLYATFERAAGLR